MRRQAWISARPPRADDRVLGGAGNACSEDQSQQTPALRDRAARTRPADGFPTAAAVHWCLSMFPSRGGTDDYCARGATSPLSVAPLPPYYIMGTQRSLSRARRGGQARRCHGKKTGKYLAVRQGGYTATVP